jgi:predicted  nucleic acid-binding Zn-ribbon protein
MSNPFERPKMPTQEEKAEMTKQRTLSDAELLKKGAEYQINAKDNLRLEPTGEQVEQMKAEMEEELRKIEEKRELDEQVGIRLSVISRKSLILNFKESLAKYKRWQKDATGKLFEDFQNSIQKTQDKIKTHTEELEEMEKFLSPDKALDEKVSEVPEVKRARSLYAIELYKTKIAEAELKLTETTNPEEIKSLKEDIEFNRGEIRETEEDLKNLK